MAISKKRQVHSYQELHWKRSYWDIPDDWDFVPIGSLFSQRRETSSDQSSFPLYSFTIEDGVTEKTERYERSFLLKDGDDNEFALVHPGDFVSNPMNLRFGAIGYSRVPFPVLVSGYYDVLTPKPERVDSRYLETFLRSPWAMNLYDRIAIGSLNEKRRIHLSILNQTSIPLPPLPEQQKIAAILSAWDRAIELTEKLIAAKQKRKQALMQQLLTGKVRCSGRDARWDEKRLDALATFVNGRAFKPADWTDVGIPIIRIQNLNGSTDFNYYRGKYDNKHRVFPGDLLFSWSGSKGTSFGPCFWHGPEGVLNQHIFRVIPSDGVQQRFLGYALEYVTVLIERKAHGSAGLVHVTKKELEQYKINIPTPHVQKKIAAVLDIAEAEVSQLNRRVAAVKQQRTCLMRQLLTGKVRVNLNADTAKG